MRIAPNEMKSSSKKCGTPFYHSPEQMREDAYWLSSKIDCWALGIIFFIIVEGHHPFATKNARDAIGMTQFTNRVLNESPKFAKTANLKYVHLITSLLDKVSKK